MYQLGYGRGVVDLKTHAAQLGWNACNPSLLSGFAFCWHIYFKRPPFFISSAWLAHTHTHEPTHTHVSRHTDTYSFHYSFPLTVHLVNCYVLHGFTHKLCLFELFLVTVLLLAYYPTIYILTDVFFTCVTGLCVLYTVV